MVVITVPLTDMVAEDMDMEDLVTEDSFEKF